MFVVVAANPQEAIETVKRQFGETSNSYDIDVSVLVGVTTKRKKAKVLSWGGFTE